MNLSLLFPYFSAIILTDHNRDLVVDITWPLHGSRLHQDYVSVYYDILQMNAERDSISLLGSESVGCLLMIDNAVIAEQFPPLGEFHVSGIPLGYQLLKVVAIQRRKDVENGISVQGLLPVSIVSSDLVLDASGVRNFVHQLDKWEDPALGVFIVHPPANYVWNISEPNTVVIKAFGSKEDLGRYKIAMDVQGNRLATTEANRRIAFVVPGLPEVTKYEFEVSFFLPSSEDDDGTQQQSENEAIGFGDVVWMTGSATEASYLPKMEDSLLGEDSDGRWLTIVCNWKCTAGWEWDWIEYLLAPIVQFHVVEDYELKTVAPNLLLCISENLEGHKDPADFLFKIRRLKQLGASRIGVLHLSDEWLSGFYDHYVWIDYVIRNYWSSAASQHHNVVTLPLGFAAGFPQEMGTQGEKRKYLWNFMGDVDKKPWREELVQVLRDNETQALGDGYLLVTGSVGGGLDKTAYRRVLEDSEFTLCPRGFNHVESFRIYEALEVGSIPILEHDQYFEDFFGKNHPLPGIGADGWKHVGSLMQNIDIPTTRRRCVKWWNHRKHISRKHLARVLLTQEQQQQ